MNSVSKIRGLVLTIIAVVVLIALGYAFRLFSTEMASAISSTKIFLKDPEELDRLMGSD
ncbi:MAG: hypothetical protein ACOC7Y_00415 [Chloroflexota bacterium]